MTADPRLVRAYRRLTRFYPPGPRRAELLGTLLECAPPGRRRPTASEVVDLARHGIRARLGRPRSRGIVVLAVLVALAAGFAGASAAARLGLEAAGPLPAGDEINEVVFPGLRVWGGGDAEKIVRQSDGEGIEYGYAISWVEPTPATRDVAAYTAAARARLAAAGWTIASVDEPADGTEGFTAERGDLALRFSDSFVPDAPWYDGDGNAWYLLWRRPPWWLTVVAWCGGLLAAASAWLLTGWMSRRVRSAPAAALGVTGAVCCLLGVLPAALFALPGNGAADETEAPFWQGLVYLGAGPAVLAGLLATLMVLVVLVRKPPAPLRRAASRWRPVRHRPRRLAAVALGLIALVGLCAFPVASRVLAAGSCTPVVPSGVVDPPGARLSYRSRIFIDPDTPAEQRNLIEAAFRRAFGGASTFSGAPTPGFTDAFCGHGEADPGVVRTLPWYWSVDLASPGLFAGMADEVRDMPGVVAVVHLPSR